MIRTDRRTETFYCDFFFFRTFKIGALLRKCNAQKEKGIPVIDIFKYKLCNVFTGRSMYMQQKTGSFRESFSKLLVFSGRHVLFAAYGRARLCIRC